MLCSGFIFMYLYNSAFCLVWFGTFRVLPWQPIKVVRIFFYIVALILVLSLFFPHHILHFISYCCLFFFFFFFLSLAALLSDTLFERKIFQVMKSHLHVLHDTCFLQIQTFIINCGQVSELCGLRLSVEFLNFQQNIDYYFGYIVQS